MKKNLVALSLAVVLTGASVLGFAGANTVSAATQPILGDVNHDGFVDELDLNALLGGAIHTYQVNLASGLPFSNREADVDQDGDVDYDDYTALQYMIEHPIGKGDLNHDGKVDRSDLDSFYGHMYTYQINEASGLPFSNPEADVTRDGVVDYYDYSYLDAIITKLEGMGRI